MTLSNIALVSTKHLWAEDGAYVVGAQAPGATALAYGIITAFSDTAAIALIQNTTAASGAKRVYLDYVRLIPTVAPASATAAFYAVKLDAVLRTPTANSATLTNAAVNMGQSGAATLAGKAFAASGGTLTIPAASSPARVVVGNALLRSSIPVINDELVIQFGPSDLQAGEALTGAAALRIVSHAPPVILDPQESAAIYLWLPANAVTALSYLIECGWGER